MVAALWLIGTALAGNDTCVTAATLVDRDGVERLHPGIQRACVLARDHQDVAAMASMGCSHSAVQSDTSGLARVDPDLVRSCMRDFGFVADPTAASGWVVAGSEPVAAAVTVARLK